MVYGNCARSTHSRGLFDFLRVGFYVTQALKTAFDVKKAHATGNVKFNSQASCEIITLSTRLPVYRSCIGAKLL